MITDIITIALGVLAGIELHELLHTTIREVISKGYKKAKEWYNTYKTKKKNIKRRERLQG